MAMTRPPCWVRGEDCKKRRVGCRAGCEEWKEWMEIHRREAEAARERRHAELDAEGFLATQGIRTQRDNRRKRAIERRRT